MHTVCKKELPPTNCYNTTLHVLCILLLSSLFPSCRPKEKFEPPIVDTPKIDSPKCQGYFISTWNPRDPDNAYEYICYTDTGHNGFEGGYLINSGYGEIDGAVYNWRKRVFYFMKPELHHYNSTGWWQFKYFSLDNTKVNDMGRVRMIDSAKSTYMSTQLVCNNSSDIVYCITMETDTCRLYEVSRNGIFNIHEICVFDSSKYRGVVAVDETSGCVFSIRHQKLYKIDATTGNISLAATYTDANPDELYYNDSDKMFYAIDHPSQYRLLRIDPSSGVLTVIGTIDKVDPAGYGWFAFDRCTNQLVFMQHDAISLFYANAYWVGLIDAKVSNSLLHIWMKDNVNYVNGKFPSNYHL